MRSAIIIGAIIIAGGLAAYAFWPAPDHSAQTTDAPNDALVDVRLPNALSKNAQIGKQAFEANCAACHGKNAAGKDGVGPPLVHIIYEPNHHNDESFQRAAAMGTKAHHWPFGDMPPVEGMTRGEATKIIAYIRELQRANGIK